MVKKMADEYDEELLSSFAEVAEELGWQSNWKMDHGSIDLETWSDAGENLILPLFEKDFQDYGHLVKRLMDEYIDFDPEEHAAMWYGQGKGEPGSLRVLLDDADGIAEKLEDLAITTSQRLWDYHNKEIEKSMVM